MSDSTSEIPAPITETAGDESPAPASAAADNSRIERARRGLQIAALVTGVLSVLIVVTLVVLASFGLGTADNLLAGAEEALTYGLIFASPMLFVIALNLLTWRAMLRPLARMRVGGRVAVIVLTVIVLALMSVVFVAGLLFAGFFVGTISSTGAGF
ncbi:hypothetical protein [Microcella sp.]|uniref:hypothetical protein n=1 Tax=Microcella sp. TaxID=1913979 RepID=UPI00299F7AEF|nr:hypothetical protein [Microcella sp.]MDX2026379.1 hypothetical protein [Microcella sp.]